MSATPSKASIGLRTLPYTDRTLLVENISATSPNHAIATSPIMASDTAWTQIGACIGNTDMNRLAKNAAVFGFVIPTTNPLRQGAVVSAPPTASGGRAC